MKSLIVIFLFSTILFSGYEVYDIETFPRESYGSWEVENDSFVLSFVKKDLSSCGATVITDKTPYKKKYPIAFGQYKLIHAIGTDEDFIVTGYRHSGDLQCAQREGMFIAWFDHIVGYGGQHYFNKAKLILFNKSFAQYGQKVANLGSKFFAFSYKHHYQIQVVVFDTLRDPDTFIDTMSLPLDLRGGYPICSFQNKQLFLSNESIMDNNGFETGMYITEIDSNLNVSYHYLSYDYIGNSESNIIDDSTFYINANRGDVTYKYYIKKNDNPPVVPQKTGVKTQVRYKIVSPNESGCFDILGRSGKSYFSINGGVKTIQILR